MKATNDGNLIPCPGCDSTDDLWSIPQHFKISQEGSEPIGWVVSCTRCHFKVEGRHKDETEKAWNNRKREFSMQNKINKLTNNRPEWIDDALQALSLIEKWGEAYPEDMFEYEDKKVAREILNQYGIDLSNLMIEAMRHVAKGCADIAREATRKQ
jgi:hypothetical protein